MTVEQSLTGTLEFALGGGRGMDEIEEVMHYSNSKQEKYLLIIDTSRGDGSVASLDVSRNYLSFNGNTRTVPFAKLHLSENATKKLEKKIKSNFDVDEI